MTGDETGARSVDGHRPIRGWRLVSEDLGAAVLHDDDRSVPEEILDATCGGQSIWLPGQKQHDNALFIDKREREPGFTGQEGRTFNVEPDEVQDFRDLPYADEEFRLVVFDPPQLMREDGMESLTGYIAKSYGALHAETWQADLRAGFEEL